MPTLEPDPVRPPVTEYERVARQLTMNFLSTLFGNIYSMIYGTRTHVPGGFDSTDLMGSLSDVRKFCEARPDWMAHVMGEALPEINYCAAEHDKYGDDEQQKAGKRLSRKLKSWADKNDIGLEDLNAAILIAKRMINDAARKESEGENG